MILKSVFLLAATLFCSALFPSAAMADCGSGWSARFVPDRFSVTEGGDRQWLVVRSRDAQRPTRGGSRRGAARAAEAIYEVSFSNACISHDECYGRSGASKPDCDKRFYRDMLSACREAIPNSKSNAQRSCIEVAIKYNDILRGQPVAYFGNPFSNRSIEVRPFNQASCTAFRNAQGNQSVKCE
jgi:hypothetical protein